MKKNSSKAIAQMLRNLASQVEKLEDYFTFDSGHFSYYNNELCLTLENKSINYSEPITKLTFKANG